MIFRAGLLALALLHASSALADEPDPLEVLQRLQQLREQWFQCVAAHAKPYVRTSRPAETIAKAALKKCRSKELPLVRVLRQELGNEGAARVLTTVRTQDRLNLIRSIEKVRAR